MSPEQHIERKKPSHGYAVHVRREKEEARRQFQPVPTWETTSGLLELRTHNFYELDELYQNNRFILKEFYEARYDIAVGRGSTKLNDFMKKYTLNEKAKSYNPELIDRLSPLFTMIRDSFPKNRTR
jgi:hypothetical protein